MSGYVSYVSLDVEVSGPFFQPGADIVTDAYIFSAQEHIAQEAEKKVKAFQSLLFRYQSSPPTGYATRHVRTRVQASRHIVTDSAIVYGPWLEGVSERNKTTRFKGYAIFRRTARSISNRAVDIAMPRIHALCEMLNR